MQVKSFDETSLTGDLYRNEKIKQEYYMTNDMLVSIGVIDGELYNVVQVYVP